MKGIIVIVDMRQWSMAKVSTRIINSFFGTLNVCIIPEFGIIYLLTYVRNTFLLLYRRCCS